MRKYCKAYKLADLRQFSGWSEKREENEPELTDESICYIWDDFVVVRSPVQEKGVVFDAITPEWREFCATTLHFEIPEDLRYAYEPAEEQEKTSA
jgi:hypothetical protein